MSTENGEKLMSSESAFVYDDDPGILELQEGKLLYLGFRKIILFSNPQSVIEAVYEEKPRIIISDLNKGMPGLDAQEELLPILKEGYARDYKVGIMVFTNRRLDNVAKQDLYQLGAHSIVDKMVDDSVFFQEVRSLLAKAA